MSESTSPSLHTRAHYQTLRCTRVRTQLSLLARGSTNCSKPHRFFKETRKNVRGISCTAKPIHINKKGNIVCPRLRRLERRTARHTASCMSLMINVNLAPRRPPDYPRPFNAKLNPNANPTRNLSPTLCEQRSAGARRSGSAVCFLTVAFVHKQNGRPNGHT